MSSTVLGAVLIIAGASWLGLSAVKQLQNRTKTLGLLVTAVDFLHAEIKYGLTPLPDIMAKLSASHPTLFFDKCTGEIKSGTSFRDTWKSAVREAGMPIKAGDRAVLEELGDTLGRYGADNQENAILLARDRLYTAYISAENEQASKSRLFGFLGVAAGALTAILLI